MRPKKRGPYDADEGRFARSVATIDHGHRPGVSELSFNGHRHGNEAGCGQLLAMHEVRRRLERVAVAIEWAQPAPVAVMA